MARRALRITYGSYVAGYGQAKRHVHGPTSGSDGPERFSFNFDLQIADCTSESDWETEIQAARTAFEKPFQDLRVDVVDEDTGTRLADFLDARESAAKGLNIVPRISDPELQEGKSGRSWVFRVTIEGDRPATHDSNYLRQTETSYTLSYSASRRRTLRVSGFYTRTPSLGARAQYEAEVSDYVTAIQTGLGGTWQTVPNDETSDTPFGDDTIRWTRTYKELLLGQSAGTLDDADVVEQTLQIEVDDRGTEDDPAALPLQRVVASYTASLDAESSSSTVQALWASKLEAWVIQNLRAAAEAGSLAITNSVATYDDVDWVIRGRVEALVARGRLIRRLVTVSDDLDEGWRFRLQIPETQPNDDVTPTPGFAFPYGRTILRTITTETEVLGASAPPILGRNGGQGRLGQPAGGGGFRFGFGEVAADGFEVVGPGGGDGGAVGGGGGAAIPGANVGGGGYRISRRPRYVTRYRGRPGEQFATTSVTITEQYRILAPPAGAGGGGANVGTLGQPQSRQR